MTVQYVCFSEDGLTYICILFCASNVKCLKRTSVFTSKYCLHAKTSELILLHIMNHRIESRRIFSFKMPLLLITSQSQSEKFLLTCNSTFTYSSCFGYFGFSLSVGVFLVKQGTKFFKQVLFPFIYLCRFFFRQYFNYHLEKEAIANHRELLRKF